MKIGDVIPEPLRNSGYSSGLEFPYIFREIGGKWLIWHRRTGKIVEIVTSDHPVLVQYDCERRCRAWNGMRDPSPEETAEINAAHDNEP